MPTDLEYGSPRTRAYADQSNRSNREDSLDQLEEARDMAYCTRRGINSPCDATTPEGFGPETSRWATWCFGYDKTPEGATSSHLPGKGHS